MPTSLPYELKRSRRKTVSLQITRDARVLVRAPNRMPKGDIDRFVEAHRAWIAEKLTKCQERLAAEQAAEPTPEDKERLKAAAKTVLAQKLAFYAARMGVTPTDLRITEARSRYGSCNSRGGICFSWRLLLYPEAAVDYVVVHELAHLKEMNHSPAFYACIAAVLPDYEARRVLLKAPVSGDPSRWEEFQ